MKTLLPLCFLVPLCWFPGNVAKVTAQSANVLTPVPIQSVTIDDGFWSPKRSLWQDVRGQRSGRSKPGHPAGDRIYSRIQKRYAW
jgi:hypothetical protein